ncbi:MAG: PepSY domain-containing protein [Acidobacteriota bacterium]|nr:PepSY domain-containing protein [Acidobacteriota bacterium]MDH3530352.1 PepSY domain-containing protein [Acidobacteriota bacterium]
MNKQTFNWWVRKSHRYLGVVLGIQFVLWTVSGVFFAWTNIDKIHGDHLRKPAGPIRTAEEMVSPSEIRKSVHAIDSRAGLTSFRIVNVLEKPYYEVNYRDAGKKPQTLLFDAVTGQRRKRFERTEAEKIAIDAQAKPQEVKETLYLTSENVGSHHEYREQPLPAWAVTFEKPESHTVYVAADNGQVIRFRTNNWRIFDFLWMLHTMDFVGRDNINNWALRVFSGLGTLMLASGFLYFFVTFRKPWGN